MKRLLKIYVQTEIFRYKIPDPANRRFFPSNSSIRNHMVSARRKLQMSMIDQECLVEKIKLWKKEDPTLKIFFRPKCNKDSILNDNVNECSIEPDEEDIRFICNDNSDTLLFVYQTEWHQRIYERYGN